GDLADNIECERLLQEPLIVALHQSHPLKNQPYVSLQALAKDAFVFVPQSLGCGFFSLVSQIFRSAGYTPGIIQEASQLQTLLSFVAAGMGITLIPASARVFQMPGIVYVDLEPPAPTVDVMVAWRGDDSSPVVRTFLKIVRNNAQTQ
ncbi:MAG TPA: LysR family substrate-binding domain-containing protein, partial [Acidobacteriota bacterium]|nr:LysR family substrate-binding domain-containing protein [Acidobacteriota bacterium]